MMNNPKSVVDDINKLGKIKYKSFNYHLIPKFYWIYLDIATILWLFYSNQIDQSYYSKIYLHVRDLIASLVDTCDLTTLSQCVSSYKINNKNDVVQNVLKNYPQYHYEQRVFIFVMKSNNKCKVSDRVKPLEYFNDHQDDLKNIDVDHLMKSFRAEFQRVTGTE